MQESLTPAARLRLILAEESAGILPEGFGAEVDGEESENNHDQRHARKNRVDIVGRLYDDRIACCCSTHDVAPLDALRKQAKACTTNEDLQTRKDHIVLANILHAGAFQTAEGAVRID